MRNYESYEEMPTSIDYKQELQKEMEHAEKLKAEVQAERDKRMSAESEAFRYKIAFELLIKTLSK